MLKFFFNEMNFTVIIYKFLSFLPCMWLYFEVIFNRNAIEKYNGSHSICIPSNWRGANQNVSYEGYMKGPVCNSSQKIRYPKTNEDVVATIREALAKGLNVKAFGARHSMTDIICTSGIPLDMKHFQQKTINPDGSATFGAGVIAWEIGTFLKKHGRALTSAPAYGNITIGGAIGTGAHGSSIKYPSSFSEQVIGVTIVDGLGRIRTINSESALRAFRVHLGLLGIVLDVTLKTVPFYKILANNYEMPDDILLDGRAEGFAKESDQFMLWWFPSLKKVVICNWTTVDPSSPGDAYTNFIVSSNTAENNLMMINNLEGLQRLPAGDLAAKINQSQSVRYRGLIDDSFKRYAPIYTEDGITTKNPAIGDWFRMISNTCPGEGPVQCTFLHGGGNYQLRTIDNEFAISLKYLPQVILRVKDIISKTPAAFPDNGIILRFSGATSTYMSLSEGHDVVQFEYLTIKRRNEYENPMPWLPAYQTILQSLALEFNGRSHWAKTGAYYHTKEMINRKLNSSAKMAFISEMKKYDPFGIFMNNFGRRLTGSGTKQDIDPKTTHCALQDNCVCQDNNDCANNQTCGTVLGYNYLVCK